MQCPKVLTLLAAGTATTPYPHTKTPNINTTHNQAKPLGRHHLLVHCDVFRLRVDRRSFSLWTPSCDSTDGWLGSPEPEPVTMFPIGFNS